MSKAIAVVEDDEPALRPHPQRIACPPGLPRGIKPYGKEDAACRT